ncbi:carboxylesterase family protein [Duganella callida]|nr:carboxylesterase family protein [Duganella callida]
MGRYDRMLFCFACAALAAPALAPAVATVAGAGVVAAPDTATASGGAAASDTATGTGAETPSRRVAAAATLSATALATSAAAGPLVRLPDGLAQGLRSGAVEQFLGLPYASAQRWQSPEAVRPWDGARAFQTLPPRCPQSAAGLAAGLEREDCLYLNVYRPAAPPAQPRAVMVYVHGGGTTNGSANDHDGSALAAQGDIIVVTINYRLGALGFLDGGNYALQDVLQALRWVQRSAASLGGDPLRVTLAGESAGGTVICPLLAAPRAKGLFRAAIISSDDCLHDVDTAAEAQQRSVTLRQRLHCADLACVRAASAAQLIQAGGGAAPAIDSDGLLRDYAARQIARRHWLHVPLLLGANRNEGRIAGPGFLRYDQQRYRQWLARLLPPEQAERVAAAYRDEHAGEPHEYAYKISAILTDSGMRGFGGCAIPPLGRAAAQDAPVYLYQFEDDDAPQGAAGGFHMGAAHAAELAYLWPDGGAFAAASAQLRPAQRKLSALMIAHWAAFVRNGNPDVAGQPAWPSLRQRAGYRAFRPDGGGQLSLDDYERQHRCELWRQLPVIMDRGEAQN